MTVDWCCIFVLWVFGWIQCLVFVLCHNNITHNAKKHTHIHLKTFVVRSCCQGTQKVHKLCTPTYTYPSSLHTHTHCISPAFTIIIHAWRNTLMFWLWVCLFFCYTAGRSCCLTLYIMKEPSGQHGSMPHTHTQTVPQSPFNKLLLSPAKDNKGPVTN